MMSFWDTVAGKGLAETINEYLPRLVEDIEEMNKKLDEIKNKQEGK